MNYRRHSTPLRERTNERASEDGAKAFGFTVMKISINVV